MNIWPLTKCMVAGLSLILASASTIPLQAADPLNLEDAKARLSYGIGMNLGMQWRDQEVEVDPDILLRGMKDAMAGGPLQLSEEQMRQTLTAYQEEHRTRQMVKRQQQASTNLEQSRAFLEQNKQQPGVVELPSGLQYKILEKGEGESPKATDQVTVHYRGTLIDGTEFDSSHQRGQPAQFGVGNVIAGWTEGLQLMSPGAKYRFFIPPNLAYGERGSGRVIGANAALIFDVELISFQSQPLPPTPEPVTSDIIKVPSKEEMERGAKIEVIKKEDLERVLKEQQKAAPTE
jgi:FKBP-type peptidyl-prolyl cis-trans isomerase FklB